MRQCTSLSQQTLAPRETGMETFSPGKVLGGRKAHVCRRPITCNDPSINIRSNRDDMRNLSNTRWLVITAICIALNVGLGKVSNLLGLPLAMDTVGTILSAVLVPWPFTLLVAILSSLAASLVIHPAFLFYIGTQLTIAVLALLFVRAGLFHSWMKAIFAGLVIGIASAVVSAPVTAVVFGGIATPSITALNAVFLAAGESLWKSVLQGALIVESIDKVIAGILVFLAIKRLPTRMLNV